MPGRSARRAGEPEGKQRGLLWGERAPLEFVTTVRAARTPIQSEFWARTQAAITVSTMPGRYTLTVTPVPASSAARLRV